MFEETNLGTSVDCGENAAAQSNVGTLQLGGRRHIPLRHSNYLLCDGAFNIY